MNTLGLFFILVMVVGAIFPCAAIDAPCALALPPTTSAPSNMVVVTILSARVGSDEDTDVWPFTDRADLYGRVTIGTTFFSLRERGGSDAPFWGDRDGQFTAAVEGRRVPIQIRLFDSDNVTDDDEIDLNPAGGKRSLDFEFDLCSMRLSGDITRPSQGVLESAGEPAEIRPLLNQEQCDSPCLMGGTQGNDYLHWGDRKHWIDPADYEHALDRLSLVPDPEVIFVSGMIDLNDRVFLGPWYLLPEGTPDRAPGTNDYYRFVFLNDQGQVLQEVGMPLTWKTPDAPFELPVTFFSLYLPYPQGTRRIQIQNAVRQTVLAERVISSNAPTIQIMQPLPGQKVSAGGTLQIAWNGNDPDGDPLEYTVLLSANGTNWSAPAYRLTNQTFLLPTTPLPAGSYTFKIVAADGANIRLSQPVSFEVQSPPDSVSVQVPAGYSTIANNFINGSNTLNEVLPSVADGTQIFKFNPATRSYTSSTYDAFENAWLPNVQLVPGEGAWVFSPVPQGITFLRTQPSPPGPLPRSALAELRFMSGRWPVASNFEEVNGFPPANGDRILFYDGAFGSLPTQPTSTYVFSNGVWNPSAPVLQPGKASFVDTIALPVLACASDKTNECGTALTFDPPSASGGCCSNLTVTVVGTLTNIAPYRSSYTRMWQVVDCCGNTNFCSQKVTVVDTTPPVITVPTNLILNCSGNTGAVENYIADAFDACGLASFNCTPPSGSFFPVGNTMVHCVASDLSGNTNSSQFTVTVLTNCSPTGCSKNLLVNGSFESPGLDDEYRYLFGASTFLTGWKTLFNGVEYADPRSARAEVMRAGVAADGVYAIDLAPLSFTGGGIEQTFSTVPGASYHVSFKMATAQFAGRDGTATLKVEVNGLSPWTFNTENHGRTLEWSLKRFSFNAGSGTSTTLSFSTTSPGETNFVALDDVRVTDCCGELICPPRVLAECQTPNGAPVAWTVVATNHCAPHDLTVTCTPPPGSWFPPGTNIVTCTVSGSGVLQTCSFPVIVAGSCGGLCEENLLVNGSFEQPGQSEGYAALGPDSDPARLPGWRILPAGVEYYDGTSLHGAVREAGAAPDGSFAVDLGYLFTEIGGGIEQAVPTTTGEAYTLSFYLGTLERDGRLGTARVEVSAGPVSRIIDVENHNNHLRWERHALSFIASASSTLVKLTTTNYGVFHGVEIDNVRLSRCPAPCVRPPQDLVLWLPFDEAGGLTAYNAMASTFNGRLFSGAMSDGSGPSRLAPGFVNNALSFDGIDDWVCVGDSPQLNVGTNDFSFDAWVRLDPSATNGTDRLIIGKFREHAVGLRFGLNEGYLFFRYDEALAIHDFGDTLPVPNDSQWHFVALTFQHGQIDGGKFYVDGALHSTFDTRTLPANLSTPGPLGVGGMLGESAWAGALDEVEFFRRSLSAGEILGLYNAGAVGKCRLDAYLHWDTMLCPNDTFADVPAAIRNFSGAPKTVVYQLRAVACHGGTNEYALTFNPAIGAYVVPAYGKVEFPVRVTLPGGMPCGARACFEILVEDSEGVRAISSEAIIFRACSACVTVPFPRVTLTNLLAQTIAPIRIQNFGNSSLSLAGARFVVFGPGMQLDTRVVRLNGQPGPIMIPGTNSILPNGTLELSLDIAFTSLQPGQRFTVVLEANFDNTLPQAVTSFDILNEIPAPPLGILQVRRRADGAVALTWADDSGVLERAPMPIGPWTEFPSGATNAVITSPFTEPTGFFRLRR